MARALQSPLHYYTLPTMDCTLDECVILDCLDPRAQRLFKSLDCLQLGTIEKWDLEWTTGDNPSRFQLSCVLNFWPDDFLPDSITDEPKLNEPKRRRTDLTSPSWRDREVIYIFILG